MHVTSWTKRGKKREWGPNEKLADYVSFSKAVHTNDPALPDSPDRSDLAGGPLGWGGIKLSVRGLPFR